MKPDEPRTYTIRDDGGSWTITSTPANFRADAKQSVLEGDWFGNGEPRTIFWDGRVVCEADGTDEALEVTIDPPEPKCRKGHEHDWQAPHEIVGGLKENPGVLGSGGGIKSHEVCAHCGWQRHGDTWAHDNRGREGLHAVSYEPADEDTLAWVASLENES